MKNFLTIILLTFACYAYAGEPGKIFKDWPSNASPEVVGDLLSQRFVEVPHPNFNGNPAPPNEITYPETCAWFGALRYAQVRKDSRLLSLLEDRFLPIFGPERYLQPKPDHVDHTVFGCIPLQLYLQTNNKIYYHMGMWYADEQWKMPRNTKHKAEYQALLDKNLSWQTRYWIDDMFMISCIQVQAYLVTKDHKYVDRAAAEMVTYLDKIQRPNGLFYHAEDAPFFWGRGNGWMAAGMTELLSSLPQDNPNYSRIMESYRKMMKTLQEYQKEDGLWGQLIDDKTSWSETSGSAMFTYALIKGVKKGWLDEDSFGPTARKAWIALVGQLDEKGDLAGVCEGTNKNNDRNFYLNRKTLPGNMHGQAPMLWCATALLEK